MADAIMDLPAAPVVWLAVALLAALGVTACFRQLHYIRHGVAFIFPPDRWMTEAWKAVGRLLLCCAHAFRAYWSHRPEETRDMELREVGEAEQVITIHVIDYHML